MEDNEETVGGEETVAEYTTRLLDYIDDQEWPGLETQIDYGTGCLYFQGKHKDYQLYATLGWDEPDRISLQAETGYDPDLHLEDDYLPFTITRDIDADARAYVELIRPVMAALDAEFELQQKNKAATPDNNEE